MWFWLLRLIGSLLAFLGAGLVALLARSLRPEIHHWSVLAGKAVSMLCSTVVLALLVLGLLILLWPAPKTTQRP
ncbi:MAG TPA: hypothetical protein VME40_13155 [Caulobacteraceae bacterium]|nr:hypothetical protein [Caulobacteraceae bacterium]